jgi:alanyl-tRNA synthetase
LGKKELGDLFSSDPDRYYRVSLFDKIGFKRQKCVKCGKFFWAIVERNQCPDHENYGFIGNPPTIKRLDYINAWREIQQYFTSNDHSIISRYPVVCRWREDLFFTIASIVDFQRVMSNKIIFELPANPLVVPQMCLRFNDIENVGLTGRHYTSFCMIGQTCNADASGGYWKDRCIELDYGLLTKGFGINSNDITFVEDVWMGAGAFGCSLEYFVCGLELGNAVFTEFEGNENDYQIMPNKIIDMGAGLERLSWITMGTPTSYDCAFGPVIQKLIDISSTSDNTEILSSYFGSISSKLAFLQNDISVLKSNIAKELKISNEQLETIIAPYEAIYTIADHTRTLLFAISDGALPSNIGGGYNLRIILRRALSIIARLGWSISLQDVADMHIDYLKQMYPELEEHRQDIRTILQIESIRYTDTRQRMNAIATSIKSRKKKIEVDDLIRMYESDGVTPDFLVEEGAIKNIPPTFYKRLADIHTIRAVGQSQKPIGGLDTISPTKMLYYEDASMREFTAQILKIIDKKYIVLDRTAFYPRGGGQEPDTGVINGIIVADVIKQGNIIVHKLTMDADSLLEGSTVCGKVNDRRRDLISKHHTATHILNTSARVNLGSWVWQNSAYKDEKYARLDITHHSALNKEELERIEKTANSIVRKNLPVNIRIYDRGDAEREYTFRIYQGGVIPSNNVRIVNIEGWDIEACGGTHVRKTGEIGSIKITKADRIQDGVVRLDFVAGEPAINYIQKQEDQLIAIAQSLGSSKDNIVESVEKIIRESENDKKKIKAILKRISVQTAKVISSEAKQLLDNGTKFYYKYDEELDAEYHIAIGEKSIITDPYLIYVAVLTNDKRIQVIVFVGEKIRNTIKASMIAKHISTQIGGSGGGDDRFGQGGGRFKDKIKEAILSAEQIVIKNT